MSSSLDSAGHCIVWQGLFRREGTLMVRTNATESLRSQQEQRNAEEGTSIWPPVRLNSWFLRNNKEVMDSYDTEYKTVIPVQLTKFYFVSICLKWPIKNKEMPVSLRFSPLFLYIESNHVPNPLYNNNIPYCPSILWIRPKDWQQGDVIFYFCFFLLLEFLYYIMTKSGPICHNQSELDFNSVGLLPPQPCQELWLNKSYKHKNQSPVERHKVSSSWGLQ